jgi:nicotinamidase-related amidase
MSLTAIDPNTALIIVDLQKGIVGAPFIQPIGPIVAKSRALADVFRRHRLPVVLVNVIGTAQGRTERSQQPVPPRPEGWTELVSELNQQAGDIVVSKSTWGAFASTNIEHRLKALNVTQVVIAGVATGTGVESTARQAYEHGFNVTLAVDAMTDTRPEAHDYSIANVFPRLGETGTTRAIIDLLETRAALR